MVGGGRVAMGVGGVVPFKIFIASSFKSIRCVGAAKRQLSEMELALL